MSLSDDEIKDMITEFEEQGVSVKHVDLDDTPPEPESEDGFDNPPLPPISEPEDEKTSSESKDLVEKPDLSQENNIFDDSDFEEAEDLELLENVFDKRVTQEQIDEQKKEAQKKNSSAKLLDKRDIELKTDLNDREIVTIGKAKFLAENYDIPILSSFVDNIMILKVSRYRKGRREFIDGLHADEKRGNNESAGMLGRFFGAGGGE